MADQDEMVARFVELTQAQPENARAVLESSNWQLEDALNLFYAAPEEAAAMTSRPSAGQPQVLDDDDFDAPQTIRRSTPPPTGAQSELGRTLAGGTVGEPSASSGPSGNAPQPPRKRGGMMTLGDLGSSGQDREDDDEDGHQDMFAGGEKSGLAIENPGRPGNHGIDSVRNIIRQAQEARQHLHEDDDEPAPRSHFTGRGQTLGSDDVPSQTIEDPNAEAAQPLPKVVRNLYFWKDGFSVEDGPLMRYDDPEHQETLRGIEAGRAPLHLMNVRQDQLTDVHVHRRMEENYAPPKKKFAAFEGTGQRLGAPTPGFDSAVASSSSSAAPVASAPVPPAPQAVAVDSSQPSTSLQIRLGDGTRLVSRFNHSHTISDVYAFVNAANTASRSRNYVLQTSFPPKELKEMDQSLKDAGLLNAVVVQKWQ
ncbi:hypothetical protein TWF696_007158 [Orbilia brochopaga]|uniref:P97 cofactor p47 n=1 Tax=Orbilia brochopaga TaxID=3140254 RepID=A0AAV9UR53_9PEZI